MKKLLFALLVSLPLTAPVCLAQSANEADVAAVKKVIISQTDAFFAKDQEKWASYSAHVPYFFWSAQGGGDRVVTVTGWEAYIGMMDGYFNNPNPGPATTFVRENFQVTVLDKVATATYLQTRQSADRNLKSREVRVLEKQGADWKLVYVYSRNLE